jgi:beta-barrel assembly-enhancing protease
MVVKTKFAKPLLNLDRYNASAISARWRTTLLLILLGMNPSSPAFATEAPAPGKTVPDFLSLPDFGDPSGALISPIEEQQLGAEFMRSVRRSVKVIDDPEVEEYIQNLGYRLVAGADPQPYRFTYFVIQEPDINAFAGPGGYIGVNSGLILMAQSESELASVLAHETAHVTQHHLLRTFAKENRASIPTMAALIAALILGVHSPQVAEAAIASTLAGSAQMQISFTRENELEADRVGMQILVSAGYDPRNMAAFFERLQQATRFYESGVPKLLLDHPVTAERIAYSKSRAEQYPHITPPDDLPFQLIRAKLRVITTADDNQSVQFFADALKRKTYANEEAAHYGYALALLNKGEIDEARKQVKWLLNKSPNRIAYLVIEAQVESAAGNGKTALKIYDDALKLYPRNYPLTVLDSAELLHEGQAAAARQLLREYLRYREPKPLLYKQLAQAENDAGFPIESLQAMAEYDYLNGQTRSAIERLNQALRLTKNDDFYHASRIEARLKELKRQAELEGKEDKDDKQKSQ